MKLTLAYTFVLFVLACNLAVSTAYSTRYYIDGDYRDLRNFDDTYNYRNSRLRRIDDSDTDDTYDYRASRLRRIDNNYDDNLVYYKYDSNRKPIRRADSESEVSYKYTPLVRYKSTRTQRKKFFVPNLFG